MFELTKKNWHYIKLRKQVYTNVGCVSTCLNLNGFCVADVGVWKVEMKVLNN